MFRNLLVFVSCLLLMGCGGGIGDLFSNPQTVQIQSAPNDSGYAWSTAGSVVKSTTALFAVGDGFFNNHAHSFLRFSLALVPAGANVTDARLVMGQESISNNPYGNLGPAMRVDQVNLGAAFDIADMQTPDVIQPLSIISQSANIGAIEADVEAALDHAVGNGWTHVDFRIRFDQLTNSDSSTDWSRLNNEGDDGGSGIRPALIVTYED